MGPLLWEAVFRQTLPFNSEKFSNNGRFEFGSNPDAQGVRYLNPKPNKGIK